MKIRLGHTHDADDAFMFYAMLNGKIDTEGLEFEGTVEPIASLNEKALQGVYDMTALSAAYLPHITEQYDLLSSGACMAKKCGPVLITRKNVKRIENVAVPGFNTMACTVAGIYNSDFQFYECSFDHILDSVTSGAFHGGVLISEDQMTIDNELLKSVDLGEWWFKSFSRPLPLGFDLVRKSLPTEVKVSLNRVFRNSIKYALENPKEAMEYALNFGRGIEPEAGTEFVKTFVNEMSVDLGNAGRKAVRFFISKMHDSGLLDEVPELDFVM